jgi:hypothetical protein
MPYRGRLILLQEMFLDVGWSTWFQYLGKEQEHFSLAALNSMKFSLANREQFPDDEDRDGSRKKLVYTSLNHMRRLLSQENFIEHFSLSPLPGHRPIT